MHGGVKMRETSPRVEGSKYSPALNTGSGDASSLTLEILAFAIADKLSARRKLAQAMNSRGGAFCSGSTQTPGATSLPRSDMHELPALTPWWICCRKGYEGTFLNLCTAFLAGGQRKCKRLKAWDNRPSLHDDPWPEHVCWQARRPLAIRNIASSAFAVCLTQARRWPVIFIFPKHFCKWMRSVKFSILAFGLTCAPAKRTSKQTQIQMFTCRDLFFSLSQQLCSL